jgi:uncharacterized protein (DUF58 family)
LLASSYPLLDVFWSMLEFFLFVVWIWVLILVFSDIFRSRDLSGAAKAAWLIIVLILPLFGVLLYLIIRGRSMEERRASDAADTQAQFDAYVRQSAGGTSTADELADLAKLKAAGTITDEDYEKAKAKILS